MLKISKNILNDPLALFEQFEVIEDPRIDRHKRYPLINILVFAFVAILSDQQSWYQIFGFEEAELAFTELYIHRLRKDRKIDKSQIVCEAIQALYEKECVATLKSG